MTMIEHTNTLLGPCADGRDSARFCWAVAAARRYIRPEFAGRAPCVPPDYKAILQWAMASHSLLSPTHLLFGTTQLLVSPCSHK